MIWYFKPYSVTKNLGEAYNEYCKLVPENDWICLLDGDAMFLRSDFGHGIQEYITRKPDVKLWIPVVNRVGKVIQCYQRQRSKESNLKIHKKIADDLYSGGPKSELWKHPKPPSMPCFVFSKKTWNEVGGFDETGQILGVDIRFSEKVLKLGQCQIMKSIYLLHYYRLNEGYRSKKHLQ